MSRIIRKMATAPIVASARISSSGWAQFQLESENPGTTVAASNIMVPAGRYLAEVSITGSSPNLIKFTLYPNGIQNDIPIPSGVRYHRTILTVPSTEILRVNAFSYDSLLLTLQRI